MLSPTSAARPWLRALLWLALGGWIGAMGLFGAMTRVAFEVVPSPEIAGHLVGRLLEPLLTTGAVLGASLAAEAGVVVLAHDYFGGDGHLGLPTETTGRRGSARSLGE